MDYIRPPDLTSALEALADGAPEILAGGTDFYPQHGEGRIENPVVDVSAIAELRGIHDDGKGWRIGALTTWTDIVNAELPPAFDGLKLAAREVGSVQIQNRATIAGNLCNASPAADGVPPLLTLDAEIQVTSVSGSRQIKLGDFIDGYRSTVLAPGEMVTAISIPKSAAGGMSSFLKLGARKYLVISIAMVAVRLELAKDGLISRAAVAVGACSEVAQRLPDLESRLCGRDPSQELGAIVKAEDLAGLSPIGDVRASADYRQAAVAELIGRALQACFVAGDAA